MTQPKQHEHPIHMDMPACDRDLLAAALEAIQEKPAHAQDTRLAGAVALVSLDLIDATPAEAEAFHCTLLHLGWKPLAHLKSTWQCHKPNCGRPVLLEAIASDLQYAKFLNMISRVDYAIQLGQEPIFQSYT